jgi:predicted acylesterase/phospholipase RssA
MKTPKLGLACAGGGVEGAVYEIGALCALEDAIIGLNTMNMDVYVGVSAGALISSNLVNGISPRDMSLAILSHLDGVNPITPEILYKPNLKEVAGRLIQLPSKFIDVIRAYTSDMNDNSVLGALAEFTELLPNGIFDNSPLETYLRENFSNDGKTNDFRKLNTMLRIVAVDLDSGKTIRFGEKGYDHVPISKAVQASSALPGVYAPVEIDGRHYVDGVARRTIHASVAFNEEVKLVFGINPIVPLENDGKHPEFGSLVDKGLPTILSQTFRMMIHSRMKAGLKGYATKYPDADVILFEPPATDYRMFFNNIFSFSTRKEVCEHAYGLTLKDIKKRRNELRPVLEKHGFKLNDALLDQEEFVLYKNKPGSTRDQFSTALARLDAALQQI